MTVPWTGIISHFRRTLVDRQQADDAVLLARFVAGRDVDAFEILVDRHAALVWGVCRRSLANVADREDVFQATFLALVRQIRTIDMNKPLAPWLYTVAVRASRRAALRNAKRRTLPLIDLPADNHPNEDRELYRAIDEEIGRLPKILRDVVVACCVQGESRGDAAVALGCTETAVKSRLERARVRLRTALTRRGVELPAVLVVLFLGTERASAKLLEKTMSLPFGTVPSAVAALVKPGLTFAAFGTLAASIGLICVAAVVTATLRPQQVVQARQPIADTKPTVLTDSYGDALPTGAVRRFGTTRLRQPSAHYLQFTPDGKTLIAGSGHEPLGVFDAASGRKLRDIGEHAINNNYEFRLTPDGQQALCLGYHVTLWDVATGKLVKRYEIGRCSSVAVAPDGKRFAVLLENEPKIQYVDIADGTIIAEKKLAVERTHESRLEFDDSGAVLAMQIRSTEKIKEGQYQIVHQPIQFWNTADGTISNGPVPNGEAPNDFALIPGTKSLAYSAKKGPIVIWDTGKEQEIRTIAPTEKGAVVTKLVVSKDGKRIAARTKTIVELFELATGKSLFKLDIDPSRSAFQVVNLSADGKQLACTNRLESTVRVWNVDTGKELLADSGHTGKPAIELAADGATLSSRVVGVEAFEWDLKTGKGVRKPEPKVATRTSPFDYSAEGKLWNFSIDNRTQDLIVTNKAGKEIATCKVPDQNSRGMVTSDDGKHLAASFQDRNSTVLIWTPGERKEPFVVTGHRDACQHLKFSHDGKTLFAGAGTHNNYNVDVLHLYDVGTGKLIRTLKSNGSPGHSLFTTDDRVLVTGGLWNDATCRVWDTATGEQTATLIDPTLRLTTESETPKALAKIEGIQFSPDERLLAVMSGIDDQSSIAVWEVGTWKLVKSFAPFRPRASQASMLFSADGRSLFVANPDTTILQWDLTGRFGQPNVEKLTPSQLDAAGVKLAAPGGYSAIWDLMDHPDQAVALFRGALKPAPKPKAEELTKCIAELDSKAFREREDAQRKLLAFNDDALPALDGALKGTLSAEARGSMEKIVEQLRQGRTPIQLRQRRMVAVLDKLADPRAKELLKEFADGDGRDRLTQDAKRALANKNVRR